MFKFSVLRIMAGNDAEAGFEKDTGVGATHASPLQSARINSGLRNYFGPPLNYSIFANVRVSGLTLTIHFSPAGTTRHSSIKPLDCSARA